MSQRTCLECSATFEQGRGRPRKHCEECRSGGLIQCRSCGAVMPTKKGWRYCAACQADGRVKACAICGDHFVRRHGAGGLQNSYCPDCRRAYARAAKQKEVEARQARRAGLVVRPDRECMWCLLEFSPTSDRQTCCSSKCRSGLSQHYRMHRHPRACHLQFCMDCGNTYPPSRMRMRCAECHEASELERRGLAHARRLAVLRRGAPGLNWRAVGERHGWICALCGDFVTVEPGTPACPGGATVDHILPIVAGGEHVWENVQLAHWSCNLRKGARVDGAA